MQTLSEIKALLDSLGATPKRSLGQNFLVDHNLIRKLVDAANLAAGELVLEVGPGTGTLTEELLARGCDVIACELDDRFAALNRERLADPRFSAPPARLRLVHGDCLESKRELSRAVVEALREPSETPSQREEEGGGSSGGVRCAPSRPFKLVANLPYGAATPLLMTLMIDHPACERMCVTVQSELVDRLTAKPREKDYGPISVIATLCCEVTKIATAPPGCFWPPPEVTSAMVRLSRRTATGTPSGEQLRRISALAEMLFQKRRKQIGGVWKDVHAAVSVPALDVLTTRPELAHVRPTMRAEELTPEDYRAIAATTPACS